MLWRARHYSFLFLISDLKFWKCEPAGCITSDPLWRVSGRLSACSFKLDDSHLHLMQTHQWLVLLRSTKLPGRWIMAGRSYFEINTIKITWDCCWTAGVLERGSAETAESPAGTQQSRDLPRLSDGKRRIWFQLPVTATAAAQLWDLWATPRFRRVTFGFERRHLQNHLQ